MRNTVLVFFLLKWVKIHTTTKKTQQLSVDPTYLPPPASISLFSFKGKWKHSWRIVFPGWSLFSHSTHCQSILVWFLTSLLYWNPLVKLTTGHLFLNLLNPIDISSWNLSRHVIVLTMSPFKNTFLCLFYGNYILLLSYFPIRLNLFLV